jgi:hypothetical protein
MEPHLLWKDLLTLATGIFGLVFSLIAYRRAKSAEERAVRAEGRAIHAEERAGRLEEQGLIDAVVAARERALAEIYMMKSKWSVQLDLQRIFEGKADEKFASIVTDELRNLRLAESSVKASTAQIKSHPELVRFRTGWEDTIKQMATKTAVLDKLFEEYSKHIHSKGAGPSAPNDA